MQNIPATQRQDMFLEQFKQNESFFLQEEELRTSKSSPLFDKIKIVIYDQFLIKEESEDKNIKDNFKYNQNFSNDFSKINNKKNRKRSFSQTFLKRMEQDLLRRRTKEERRKMVEEKAKKRLPQNEIVSGFNRLIDDANRRIEVKAKIEQMKKDITFGKKTNSINNNKVYSKDEWQKIYNDRFEKYWNNNRKKIEDKQKQIKDDKERQIESYVQNMKAKTIKLPNNKIDLIATKLYEHGRAPYMYVNTKPPVEDNFEKKFKERQMMKEKGQINKVNHKKAKSNSKSPFPIRKQKSKEKLKITTNNSINANKENERIQTAPSLVKDIKIKENKINKEIEKFYRDLINKRSKSKGKLYNSITNSYFSNSRLKLGKSNNELNKSVKLPFNNSNNRVNKGVRYTNDFTFGISEDIQAIGNDIFKKYTVGAMNSSTINTDLGNLKKRRCNLFK